MRENWGAPEDTLSQTYLAFALFPFVTVYNFGSDVQPYAVVLATAFLMLQFGGSLPGRVLVLLIPFAASLVCAIVADLTFYSIRGVVSYWGLFAHAATAYLIAQHRPELVRKWLYIAVWTWAFIGLLQVIFGPDFVRVIVPNLTTDAFRGVTSLATEPSFYGIACVFMMLLARALDDRFPPVLSLLLAAQILLLSRSIIGVLLLLVLVLSFLVGRLSFVRLTAFLATAGIGAYLFFSYTSADTRLIYFVRSVFSDDPLSILEFDTSVNARLNHAIYSVKGFIDDFGLPHGFNQFEAYIRDLLNNDPTIVWLGATPEDLKIMSGYGAVLFELGWFGVLIIVALTICMWHRFRHDVRSFWAFAVTFTLMMFNAMQVSLPLVGVVAGVCAAGGARRRIAHGRDQDDRQGRIAASAI